MKVTTLRNSLYVDKSGLISCINNTIGTVDKLTCVSRPRRFGKSFAAKMLCAYYDRSCDSRNLFLDLEISKDPSFEKHLNKYEVLYLDLIWFISNAKSMENTVKNLQHDVIEELRQTYPECVQDNETSLPRALSAVNIYNGSRFFIIIDEWDALFREAKENTDLQKEYIRLLRGLFKSSQTDKIIAAAYMTGILPIKKYGTQSAMTDFREYTNREILLSLQFSHRSVCRGAKPDKDTPTNNQKSDPTSSQYPFLYDNLPHSRRAFPRYLPRKNSYRSENPPQYSMDCSLCDPYPGETFV